MRDLGEREQQLLGDQIPDARVQKDRRPDAPGYVVAVGPGDDRHRSERVSHDDRAPSLGDARRQHGLEVLAEALEAVVASAGGLALAVASLVVGDDAKPALGQRPDHVDPVLEGLGPAVCEHDRRAVLGAEHLRVKDRPVGRGDEPDAALWRRAEQIVLGVVGDPAHVHRLRDPSGRERAEAEACPEPAIAVADMARDR